MTDIKNVIKELEAIGIHDVKEVVYNPSYEQLFEEETKPGLEGFEKGTLTTTGAVAVDTGIFTGRSPKDKYIVLDDTTKEKVMKFIKGRIKDKTVFWVTHDAGEYTVFDKYQLHEL